MNNKLWGLKFWDSPEWERVNARLDADNNICPSRSNMFSSLAGVAPDEVRLVFVGQDPYPSRENATGRAFEVPRTIEPEDFPPTLKSIFREYQNDLSLPPPSVGDLSRWVQQGVLLWNSIPSCRAHASMSHDWREYDALTTEVLSVASQQGCVFVFFGAVSKRYVGAVDQSVSRVIETAHPSPRGSIRARNPFVGSRIFSRTNQLLRELGKEPIDWKLD